MKQEFAQLERAHGIYKKFVEQRMIEDVKLKAELAGFPKEWVTKEQVLGAEGLEAILGKAVDADVWVRKDGSGVGVAMVEFGSVADRRAAVQKSKELKLQVAGKNIFLNHAQTEIE